MTPYLIGRIITIEGGLANRTFIQSEEFSKKWDALGFNDDDLRMLERDIGENPKKYPVIRGTGRLRKGRISFHNRGKRGSARFCYADFEFAGTIFLVTIFAKNEKSNLSMRERKDIKNYLLMIEKDLEEKR